MKVTRIAGNKLNAFLKKFHKCASLSYFSTIIILSKHNKIHLKTDDNGILYIKSQMIQLTL